MRADKLTEEQRRVGCQLASRAGLDPDDVLAIWRVPFGVVAELVVRDEVGQIVVEGDAVRRRRVFRRFT